MFRTYLRKFLEIRINVETRNPTMKDAVFGLKGHPNNLRVISPKDRFYFLVALSPLGIWNKSCNLQTIKTYQLKFLGLVVRFVSSSKSKNLSTFFCGCFFYLIILTIIIWGLKLRPCCLILSRSSSSIALTWSRMYTT